MARLAAASMDESLQDTSVMAYATSEGGSVTTFRTAAGVISALAAVLKAGRQEAVYPVALRLMAWVPSLFDSAAGLSSGARRLVVKLATRAVLVLCPSAAPGCEVRHNYADGTGLIAFCVLHPGSCC